MKIWGKILAKRLKFGGERYNDLKLKKENPIHYNYL